MAQVCHYLYYVLGGHQQVLKHGRKRSLSIDSSISGEAVPSTCGRRLVLSNDCEKLSLFFGKESKYEIGINGAIIH